MKKTGLVALTTKSHGVCQAGIIHPIEKAEVCHCLLYCLWSSIVVYKRWLQWQEAPEQSKKKKCKLRVWQTISSMRSRPNVSFIVSRCHNKTSSATSNIISVHKQQASYIHTLDLLKWNTEGSSYCRAMLADTPLQCRGKVRTTPVDRHTRFVGLLFKKKDQRVRSN